MLTAPPRTCRRALLPARPAGSPRAPARPARSPNKTARMEGVPESGITEQRAAGFKTSVYRSMKGNTTKIF